MTANKTFYFEDVGDVTAYFYNAGDSINSFHDMKKIAYNIRKQLNSMPQDVCLHFVKNSLGRTEYLLITEKDS